MMETTRPIAFRAEVWLHPGPGGWHFVTLPQDACAAVRFIAPSVNRPFRSLPVEATLNGVMWRTSLFPSAARSSFDLPLKTAIRTATGVSVGAIPEIEIRLL